MPTFETRRTDDGSTSHRVKVRLKGHKLVTGTFARRTVNGDQEPRLFGGEEADLHSRVVHAMVA